MFVHDMENDIDNFFESHGGFSIPQQFTRVAIKSVFDECLNQLYILRHLNVRNVGAFDPFVVQYQAIEERFTGTEDHANARIPNLGTNQDKLAHDINALLNIIKETCYEVEKYGTHKILRVSIKNLKRMAEDEKQVRESRDKNEKLEKSLTKLCEEERLANMKTMEETNNKIHQVKFEVENTIAYGNTENKFFKNYEAARREQNEFICKTKEKESLDVIKEKRERIKLEMKCHNLFLEYIEEDQTDLLADIKYWVKQYNKQTDQRDNEMLKLNGNLEFTQDTLEKLSKKYESRQEKINKWKEYKRIKQEKEDRIKLEIKCTNKIQAWWRGTMCRRSIPPGNMTVVAAPAKGAKKKKK